MESKLEIEPENLRFVGMYLFCKHETTICM